MPNTLAHIGVHSLATRAILPGATLAWIYLGCILPDVPWILQRILKGLELSLDPYAMRLYGAAQASLVLCLLLGAAFASLAPKPRRVFAILALGSLFHLLLDSLQTKWGNGVHLFAPFDWSLLNFELFWPESPITLLLTLSGLIWLVLFWRQATAEPPELRLGFSHLLLAAAWLTLWLVLPLALMDGPRRADNYSVLTLEERTLRPGRSVELHRADWVPDEPSGYLLTLAGEPLRTEGLEFERFTRVSVRGVFVDDETVRVTDFHVHRATMRDVASYVGLLGICLTWLLPWARLRLGRSSKPAASRDS